MAEPKRGSVEAFRAAEKERKARVASKGKFKIFGKAGSFDSPKKAEAKRKFNEKVAAANKKRINQESVKKFKAAEARRQTRLRNVNKINPNSPKAKRIAANKRAEADVEKDLPKSKINTTAATTVGTAVGAAATKTKPVAKTPVQGKDKPSVKAAVSSFGEAFKKARAKGVGTKFAYNDKMYSAVTRDDISRAGKTSLQDFLNSTKRKDTKIAKAPGQIIKKQEGGMAEISREDLKRLRDQLMERRGQNPMTPLPRRRPRPKNPSPGRPLPRIPKKLREEERGQGNSPRQFQTPGAAVSDREMKSLIEQMGKAPVQDRMKTGGSVMARGCKLGRKKPTKMY